MAKKTKEKLPNAPLWTGDDKTFELENVFTANLKAYVKEAVKELSRIKKLKRLLTGVAATEPVADDLVAQRVTQGQARSWFVNAVAWWNARVLGAKRILEEHFSDACVSTRCLKDKIIGSKHFADDAKCPDSVKFNGQLPAYYATLQALTEGLATKLGKTETAADSSKLGGQLPAYYLPSGNLADNGWCRLSNGLILQWGYQHYKGSWQNVIFGITFPQKALNIVTAIKQENNTSNETASVPITLKSTAATGFTYALRSTGESTFGIFWFATGY